MTRVRLSDGQLSAITIELEPPDSDYPALRAALQGKALLVDAQDADGVLTDLIGLSNVWDESLARATDAGTRALCRGMERSFRTAADRLVRNLRKGG